MGKIIGIAALVLVFLVLGFIVIKSEPKRSGLETSTPTPQPSLTESGIVEDVDELITEDIKVGTGSAVKSGDSVTVHYLGTLLDGTKFDSSYDRGEPFTTQIGVGAVIKGWDEGMIGMKVGGKRKLTIPSALGYGDTGAGRLIPPDAGLIFEIELLDVVSPTQ